MTSWLERRSIAQIEYLKAENRALRSRLGRRRILFADAERRTLGALAKEIGIKALRQPTPIFSPATLLRWHRQLVALKWTFLERRPPGRPRTPIGIEQLVVRMAPPHPVAQGGFEASSVGFSDPDGHHFVFGVRAMYGAGAVHLCEADNSFVRGAAYPRVAVAAAPRSADPAD